MGFSIELENGRRESFEEYRYRICRDGQLVAHYWHDYRGDDHGIRFLDGTTKSWPVGNLLEFIQGGGSQPVTLTRAAVAYLEENSTAPAKTPPPLGKARGNRLLVLAALASWLACLFLPPLVIDGRDSSGLGIGYLLTGWMGPLALHFEWYANPLFFVAAFCAWRGHWKTAFACALFACLLVMLLPMRGAIYADEGGHVQRILSFRLGYWLWFAAPALVLLGSMPHLRPAR